MAIQIGQDLDLNNSAKIINLGAPVNDNDAVRKIDLNSIASGTSWKDAVRTASTANVNLAGAVTTVDGITIATNDRVLIKDQTLTQENGIYIYSGSNFTRALDGDSTVELEQAITTVEEGVINGGVSYRQTQVNFTLDTDPVLWTIFAGGASPATTSTKGIIEIATQVEVDAGIDTTRAVTPDTLANYVGALGKYNTLIGNGTDTIFTITHSLNNSFPQVIVFDTVTNREILTEVITTSVNTLTITFSFAPTSNKYNVSVIG